MQHSRLATQTSIHNANRLHQSAIEQLRERVSSLFKLRANRQEEIAMLAEKITLLWDRLGVDSAVREAWVLQNNGKITDGVVHACGKTPPTSSFPLHCFMFSSVD